MKSADELTNEELERLVGLFEVLIEIDQQQNS